MDLHLELYYRAVISNLISSVTGDWKLGAAAALFVWILLTLLTAIAEIIKVQLEQINKQITQNKPAFQKKGDAEKAEPQ